MKFLRLSLFLFLGALLAACSSLPDVSMPDIGLPSLTSVITPYRLDIRQGNYVSQEMVAQLKPGMTRDQVRFVLGTPLVADIFHADRWDYIYRFQPGHGELEQRRLTVYFIDNKLARVAGDVVAAAPADAEAAANLPSRNRVIDIGVEGEGKAENKGEKVEKVNGAKQDNVAKDAAAADKK